MKPRATIRRAVEADVEAIAGMLAALSAEIGYADDAAAKIAPLHRYGFGDRPLFRALVADGTRGPLGVAIYFPEFSTLRAKPGVYLQDIYLVPEARAGGLGRRLLAAVIRDAAEWEAVYLRLAAHEGNGGALGFYARLGFQTDPRERPHWVEGAALEDLKASS